MSAERDPDALLAHYAGIEATMPLRVDTRLGELVMPKGNEHEPFHRWFHLKESFSYGLLSEIVRTLGLDDRPTLTILDPFCGGGTTCVSAVAPASLLPATTVNAVGLEINPFLYRLARTKAQAATAAVYGAREDLLEVVDTARRSSRRSAALPELSTFARTEYFPRPQRDALAAIALVAMDLPTRSRRQRLVRDLALIALAAIVEPSSRLRRDGRTMRFHPDRPLDDPYALYEKAIDVVATDLETATVQTGRRARIVRGDGRRAGEYAIGIKPRSCDLVLFSPPYPNNIDYTEVYKLEAWLTGAYTSAEAFRAQRLRTLRSHPSVLFEERYDLLESSAGQSLLACLKPVLASIPEDRYALERKRLVLGYVDDMMRAFASLARLVRRDGYVVYVVANSLHGRGNGGLLLAADLLLAQAAIAAGYQVRDFRVARQLHRRGNAHRLLRESVVVLQPA